MLVDGGNSKDSILSYIGVTVFEARASGGKERFDELGFPKLAQESQGISPNVFIGMLEIISDAIARI